MNASGEFVRLSDTIVPVVYSLEASEVERGRGREGPNECVDRNGTLGKELRISRVWRWM